MTSARAEPEAARAGGGHARFRTSLRLQAIEHRRRLGVLVLVLALPVAFFSATFFTSPTTPVPIEVPERGGAVEMSVPERETWPLDIGLMGVSWVMAAAAFFAGAGSLERDRRLVLGGYAAWQIVLARLTILAGLAAGLAVLTTVGYPAVVDVRHPELLWAGAFFAGLIAAAFGLLLGSILPRPTEGMLVIIGFFGIGSSLGPEAGRFFPTYPAERLLLVGRLAEDPAPAAYLVAGLVVAAVLALAALLVWRARTRVAR
jgi:MFS family permease